MLKESLDSSATYRLLHQQEIKYIYVVQTERKDFKNNIQTLITWKFNVFFVNGAPLNKELKYKDSALQINWILTKEIGWLFRAVAVSFLI